MGYGGFILYGDRPKKSGSFMVFRFGKNLIRSGGNFRKMLGEKVVRSGEKKS